MRYLSVCSGIESATVAWHPLGWSPVAFAEIDKFPSRVLAHHYPAVPNLGDMTKLDPPDADLLVGGTPCQSFSVAGLRGGMADPRGNLALVYLGLADRLRPRWIVWENVPGVLSSNRGRDFGAFLGGLAQLGYGFAYRVLDAQFFGLAQRRKRVFVVGCLGDWRRAAAVLLERASVCWDPPPSRATREIAPTIPSRRSAGGGLGTDFDCDGGLHVVNALTERPDRGGGNSEGQRLIAHALRADGFDASEDGTGRGTPIIADSLRSHPRPGSNSLGALTVAYALNGHHGRADGESETFVIGIEQLTSVTHRGQPSNERAPTISGRGELLAFNARQDVSVSVSVSDSLGSRDTCHGLATRSGVRRLTPRECERLHGFPDDYTAIPGAKDGPRYKALGNSMAVPIMRWIGKRIDRAGGSRA